MKNVFVLTVLLICVAAPSFAGDVVGHSVKVAGKDSGKAVAVAVQGHSESNSKGREDSLLTARFT